MPVRVLIADDDARVRSLMQSHVQELPGFEVCASVGNGIDAVEAATVLRPDALILDVLMPQLNGIAIAGILKKDLPGAKTILFTLHADGISPQAVTALGATLVSKADGLRALRRALKKISDTKAREVNEGLARAITERRIDAGDLDLLTRQFSAGLSRCGRDLKYLWVNDYYAKFVQRPAEKIVRRSILDVLGKSAFDVSEKYFDQALRGEPVKYDVEVEIKSVGCRRVIASYKATFDAAGSPDGWLAYVEYIAAGQSSVA